MSEEPDSIIVELLREIRQQQARQSTVIEAQSNAMNGRFDILQETLAYTRGLAAHGHVRLDLAEKRMEDLEARVARLEAR